MTGPDSGFDTAEIILKALNIILPEIISGLYFNEAQFSVARILHPVQGAEWDVDALLVSEI